ncbi:flippase [Bacillus timonensis]|uniref:Flippase n=1 Tax=Bacillus timonensis TaxID=1033734 RepID=A0A4V3V7P9_9BACI|nr:flippase [Bacillus timonensis]THE12303.1 flippase [Bacillus timonensis]
MSTLKKNFFYVFLQQFLLIGLPFLTIPYVSRVLGPDGVGHYSYSFSIVTLVITIFLLGSNLYSTREIAKVKNQKEKLSRTFFEIMTIRILLLSGALLLYVISCLTFFKGDIIFYLQTLHLIGAFFDVTWLFQGLELFKKVVIRNISVKFIGFGSVFLFVHDKEDVWLYTLIMGASVLIGNILLVFGIQKYVSWVTSFSKDDLKVHLLQMLLLFIPALSGMIYSVMDKTMLGSLSTVQQVGFYEQSYKIVYMITSILNITGIVMLPRASSLIAGKQFDKLKSVIQSGITINLFISIPMTFGLFAISGNFVNWFLGSSFKESIVICMIMSPIIVFKSIGVIFGSWYLVPMEKNKEYTLPIMIGAIINIILNFILIPPFGAAGAAVSTVFTEGLIVSIQAWYLKGELPIREILNKRIFRYLLLSLVMVCLIYGIDTVSDFSNLIMIIIKVLVGIGVYMGILFLLKDQSLFMLLDYFKTKKAKANS